MKEPAKRRLKSVVSGLIVLGTVLGVILGFVLVSNAMNLSYYRVETGSMEPVLPVGTIVIVSRDTPYRYGEAITFMTDKGLVTHCYLGKNKDGSIITRGVANPSNDAFTVYPRDVKGTVVRQFKLLAPEFWLSPQGIGALAGIGFVFFGLYLWHRAGRSDPSDNPPSGQPAMA